jgi:hypothetical protein
VRSAVRHRVWSTRSATPPLYGHSTTPGQPYDLPVFAPEQAWITAYTAAIRTAMIVCKMRPNSCIEVGCVGVGLARRHGHIPEPIPVAVYAHRGNEATVVPGADSKRDDGFAGHLVLHFAGGAFLDLTADQFHDARRGILLPGPIVLPGVTRQQITDGFEVGLSTGTTVRYRELVDDIAWRRQPAWTDSSELTIGIADRELRRLLAGGGPHPSTGTAPAKRHAARARRPGRR